jgi:hypothetical protein
VGRGVEFIYYMQKFLVGGDIRHGSTVMGKADIAFGIDDTVQRHPSQLEEIHFLPVPAGYRMVGIRQTDKGNSFLAPILSKRHGQVRSHSQNFCATARELLILIS